MRSLLLLLLSKENHQLYTFVLFSILFFDSLTCFTYSDGHCDIDFDVDVDAGVDADN